MADYQIYRDVGELKREQEKTKRNIRIVIDYLKKNDPEFKKYMRGHKHEDSQPKKK